VRLAQNERARVHHVPAQDRLLLPLQPTLLVNSKIKKGSGCKDLGSRVSG
jgi:hypothetical protein